MLANIPVDVRRKAVRGLRIVVHPDGRVCVSVPWLMSYSRVEQFLLEKQEWIIATRDKLMSAPKRVMHSVSKEQAQALVDYLNQAVPMWCQRMGEQPVQIRIRNLKSMWGNCRWRERLVTLNLQLALVPHELVDYVIVHELAHLRVQNHSAAFHARVQEFIPDERERRKKLNKILKV